MPVSIVAILRHPAVNEPPVFEEKKKASELNVPYFLFELELITNDLYSAVGSRERVREDSD